LWNEKDVKEWMKKDNILEQFGEHAEKNKLDGNGLLHISFYDHTFPQYAHTLLTEHLNMVYLGHRLRFLNALRSLLHRLAS
jgi:hypothetical protein